MTAIDEREEQLAILQKKYPVLEKVIEAQSIISKLASPLLGNSDAMTMERINNLEEILIELKGEREI
jgi:hypothetical protein